MAEGLEMEIYYYNKKMMNDLSKQSVVLLLLVYKVNPGKEKTKTKASDNIEKAQWKLH